MTFKIISAEECAQFVGPGWRSIVLGLYNDLVNMGWDRDVHQIKEKFGGLRFYIGRGDAMIFERIDLAEASSRRICEDCGMHGQHRDGGWMRTTCESCESLRKNKFKKIADPEGEPNNGY